MHHIRSIVQTVAICAAVALAGCAATSPSPMLGADPIVEASQQASAEQRLLLAYFTATWCVPCRAMALDTWQDPRVKAWLAEHADVVTVDIDRHPATAETFGVRGIPVTIAFHNGEEIDRIASRRLPDEFLTWLDDLTAGRVQVTRLQRALQQQEAEGEVDPQLHHALAEELMRREVFDEAAAHYARLWNDARQVPFNRDTDRVDLRTQIPWDMRTLARRAPAVAANHFEPLRLHPAAAMANDATDITALEDWLTLSAILNDQAAMVDWLGGLDETALNRFNHLLNRFGGMTFYGWGELFIAAVDLKRWDLVLTLREHRAQQWYGRKDAVLLLRKQMQSHASLLRRLHPISHDELRRSMRYEAAALHAACLATDRDSDARVIADTLLARLNDTESRLALLEQAVRTGRIHHYHRVWLAEVRTRLGSEHATVARLDEAVRTPQG